MDRECVMVSDDVGMEREKFVVVFLNWERASEARGEPAGCAKPSFGRAKRDTEVSKAGFRLWNTDGLRTGEEPRSSVVSHPIAKPTNRSASEETQQGT